MDLVFLLCVGALALVGARAWSRRQPWRVFLGETAALIAVAGFSGAQAILSGGWALGVGLCFVAPGLAVSLLHTGSVLLHRHGATARIQSEPSSTAEKLLHSADVEDLRARRETAFKVVRGVTVGPGVVVALSGVALANAMAVAIGVGFAALGLAVVAQLRRETEGEDRGLPEVQGDEAPPHALPRRGTI